VSRTSAGAVFLLRSTGLVLAFVSLGNLFAASALADTRVGIAKPVARSTLRGVACASATRCLAVGNNGSRGVVVVIRNGTPGAATKVAGTGGGLSEVGCSSATSCVAVGGNAARGGGVGVVVPITNGTPGAATKVAGSPYLSGVACSSATNCVAVGAKDFSEMSGVGVLVSIINGVPGAATPVAGSTYLSGVACSSATSCVAVGDNASSDVGVVVPITNGTPGVPTPVAGTRDLSGVACSSATSCVAVGSDSRDVGMMVPVTNGIPGAATPVYNVSLTRVACASATSCVAVANNFFGGVVVTIRNGIPVAATTSLFNRGFSDLGAVACASATRCLAVGNGDFLLPDDAATVVPITITPAPDVAGYRLTNSTFVVAGGSTPKAAAKTKKHRKGTTFRYTLSEAATVKIALAERRAGRRRGERCVAPTRRLRHDRKCTRILVKGTLTRVSHQGANSVAFSGRIGSRALTPGSYQATLTATDPAKNTSQAQTLVFRIVKR